MKVPDHLAGKVIHQSLMASKNYSINHPSIYRSSTIECFVDAFTEGASFGYQLADEEHRKLLDEVMEYCEPHLDQMWAARIVGILLNCDFRDCKSEIEKLKAQRVENG